MSNNYKTKFNIDETPCRGIYGTGFGDYKRLLMEKYNLSEDEVDKAKLKMLDNMDKYINEKFGFTTKKDNE